MVAEFAIFVRTAAGSSRFGTVNLTLRRDGTIRPLMKSPVLLHPRELLAEDLLRAEVAEQLLQRALVAGAGRRRRA